METLIRSKNKETSQKQKIVSEAWHTFKIANPSQVHLFGREPYNSAYDIEVKALCTRTLTFDEDIDESGARYATMQVQYEADIDEVLHLGLNVLPFISSGSLAEDLHEKLKDLAVANAKYAAYKLPKDFVHIDYEHSDLAVLVTFKGFSDIEMPKDLVDEYAAINGIKVSNVYDDFGNSKTDFFLDDFGEVPISDAADHTINGYLKSLPCDDGITHVGLLNETHL